LEPSREMWPTEEPPATWGYLHLNSLGQSSVWAAGLDWNPGCTGSVLRPN
ncbi:hypothetical protein M91_07121, partial [Bos mutus]